jgi:uncharacterized protein (DUF1501 family)
MFGCGTAPAWLARAASASTGRRKVLVTIFQRGAADGLNIVVPYGESGYYAARPNLAIARPGSGEGSALDLNGFLGLHPSLSPLADLYKHGELAIVTATGSPDPTRSHFDAQDYMESGTPGQRATTTGWLNRALAAHAPDGSPLAGVSIGAALPHALRGPQPAIAVGDLNDFGVRDAVASQALSSMYEHDGDPRLESAGRETFEAVSVLKKVATQPYRPAAGVLYPNGRFGDSLRQIARLIKAGVGLEVAFADIGGWDHHVNEAGARPSRGQLANLLSDFGAALAAFRADLGDRMEDVVLVTMSEFGRTVKENGSRGTDHGHGSVMFVLGGGVKGGAVHGDWPGLGVGQLYDGRDLAVTTDFRTVLAELVERHLRVADVSSVFPGFEVRSSHYRGVLRV